MQLTLLNNKKLLTYAVLASTLLWSQAATALDINSVVVGPLSTNVAPNNPINIKSQGAVIGVGPVIRMDNATAASVVSVGATTANATFGVLSSSAAAIDTGAGVFTGSTLTVESGGYIKGGTGGGNGLLVLQSPNFILTNSGTIEATDPNLYLGYFTNTNFTLNNSGILLHSGSTPLSNNMFLLGTGAGSISNLATGNISVKNLGVGAIFYMQTSFTITNLGKISATTSTNSSRFIESNSPSGFTFINETSGSVSMPKGILVLNAQSGAFSINNKGTMTRTDTVASNSSIFNISNTNSGSISNTGTMINSDPTGIGIALNTGTFTGTLTNSGTLTAGRGIYLNANSVSAGVSNSTTGTITGNSTVAGNGQGILIENYPALAPSTLITNQGKIVGQSSAIEIKTLPFTGSIINSGTLTGTTGPAIYLNGANMTGDLTNSGTISTGSTVIEPIISTKTGAILGNINNNTGGVIAATGTKQDALYFTATPPTSVNNQGTISSLTGRAIFSDVLFALGITNTGTLSTVSGANVVDLTAAGATPFTHSSGTLTGNVVMGAGSTFTMGQGVANEKVTFAGNLTRANAAGVNNYIIQGGTLTGTTNTTTNITTAMTGAALGATNFMVFDSSVIGNLVGGNGLDHYEIKGSNLQGNLTGVSGSENLVMDTGIVSTNVGSVISGVISKIQSIIIIKGNQDFQNDISISGNINVNTVNTTTSTDPDVIHFEGVTKVGGKIDMQKNSVVALYKDVTAPNFNNMGGEVVLFAPVKITGNYTQTTVANPLPDTNSVGTLRVVLSPSQNNILTVTGNASMAGTVIVDFNASTYIANGQKVTLVSAGTLVDNGTTISVQNSPIVTFTKDPSPLPGKLSAVATRTNTYDKLATTPLGVQIGGILEQLGKAGPVGDAALILGQLDSLQNNIDFNSALLQIAPDVNGSVPVESLSIQSNFLKSISTRLDIVRAQQIYDDTGYGYGYSAGDWGLSGQSTWVQAYNSFARQEKRTGVNGYGANTYGVAVGTDALVDDALRFGVSLGGGINNIKSKVPLINKLDITSAQASLYGSIIGYAAYIDWQFMGSRNWYKGKRNLKIGILDYDLTSAYKAWQYGARAEGGLSFFQGSLEITPFVGGYVSYMTIEKYKEKGATGIALNVQSAGYNYLQGNGGMKWAYPLEFSNGLLSPEFRVVYNREFINDLQKVNAQYSSGGPAFTVLAYSPAKAGLDFGASFSFFANNNYSLRFNYDFNSKASYRSSSYSLTFRREFLS